MQIQQENPSAFGISFLVTMGFCNHHFTFWKSCVYDTNVLFSKWDFIAEAFSKISNIKNGAVANIIPTWKHKKNKAGIAPLNIFAKGSIVAVLQGFK